MGLTRKDAYGRLALLQDAVLEPLNAPLRDIAVRMAAPRPGMRVLDVGCGTGAQLERYLAAGCHVVGVDTSPAMLARARRRLEDRAELREADAQSLPFDDGSFSLVTATLALHEMTPQVRVGAVEEMVRVLDDGGRLLFVDFHPGPARGVKGRAIRLFTLLAESIARHRDRSQEFLAAGGVPGLAADLGLQVERTKVVSGGNIGLYLLKRSS